MRATEHASKSRFVAAISRSALHGADSSDALDLVCSSTRSSLACSFERELANLVEEDRAPVGDLQLAPLQRDGAREGPGLVAEQLTLEQVLGDRAQLTATKGSCAAGSRGGWRAPRTPCPSRSRRARAQASPRGRHAQHLKTAHRRALADHVVLGVKEPVIFALQPLDVARVRKCRSCDTQDGRQQLQMALIEAHFRVGRVEVDDTEDPVEPDRNAKQRADGSSDRLSAEPYAS